MDFDEQVIQQIMHRYEQAYQAGELPDRQQLQRYYDNFRQNFGPQVLRNLDGPALLEKMHLHGNRDSLVYWLEFKNDEELPYIFGSISGGSSFKFGVYQRQETGQWVTGSAHNPQEIDEEEAVVIAHRHRDQLLTAVDLLEKLPVAADDERYARLQSQLEQEAPDVQNTAWGHKYLSLLFPDRLDDYHVEHYQRFHLIKLLQVPPRGNGRYICAGRFVALARQLEMPMNHLTTVLNKIHGEPYRYWRVGTEWDEESFWLEMQQAEQIGIGWAALGDLSDIEYSREGKSRLRDILRENYPDQENVLGRKTQEIFNFIKRLRADELVVAAQGQQILGIGRVVGDYQYMPDSPLAHRRPVEWLSFAEWSLPQKEGLRTSFVQLRKHEVNQVAIERQILGQEPIAPPPVEKDEPGPQPAVKRSRPLRLSGIPRRIQQILERKKQVILYGPPGTGKTYWARLTARDLAAHARFGVLFEELSEEQQALLLAGSAEQGALVRLCTFHPAYGYEDFLEGYRPQTVAEQLSFSRRDGIFKKLCDDARHDLEHRYYLIIDEINRGDIPRIFGELLTVLEKDKREEAILLPLSGERFSVPSNVYLIGTMNTADRSIALLDTALRRRFGFIELLPDSTLFGQAVVGRSIPLGAWLEALNERILQHIGRDARNLQIGHAYFLENGQPVTDFKRFSQIIQDDIIALLEEYCYEDYTALARILGHSLVNEARQLVRHELFAEGREDELIQALLEPTPDLVTSAQGAASLAAQELSEAAAEEAVAEDEEDEPEVDEAE